VIAKDADGHAYAADIEGGTGDGVLVFHGLG
jgi:hypothetical protein